tara:strand:+ start:213 stop:599 length:387 start_codon:yes stop_codon:yes gene_type:complete
MFDDINAYRTIKGNTLDVDVKTSELIREQYTVLKELADKTYIDRPYTYPVSFQRQQKLIFEAMELLQKTVDYLESETKSRRSEFHNPSDDLLKHNVELAKDKWEYISEQELHADGYCSVQFQGGVCNG